MKIEHKDRGWVVEDENGNKTYFGEYGIAGACEGVIYKDYEAFRTGKGVCYVNEYGFENSDQNSGELFEFSAKENVASELVDNPYWTEEGYTRQNLLDLVNGDEKKAEMLFELCEWTCPETILDQWEEFDEENGEGEYEEVFA